MPRTSRATGTVCVAVLGLLAWWLSPAAGEGPRPVKKRAAEASEQEYEARRLLKAAQDLLTMGEKDRGVRMLETIVEQHPSSEVRWEVYLTLGRHFLETGGDKAQAIACLRQLTGLLQPGKELEGARKEMYLEGLYLTGVAHFQARNYAGACAVLRQITKGWPNTVWANQAYYYIGMSHFAQKNWNEAVKNLSLVGTFVDPDSPTVDYIEAGRRLYIKVADSDLPVLRQLGQESTVAVTTAKGDSEGLRCVALSEREGIYIGSVPTAVGPAKSGDGVLQVVGGDEITVQYVDANTKEGQKDVVRKKTVRVVSTAALSFTVSTYASPVPAAFLGQPLYVLLRDVDLDTSGKAETVGVKVMSRYKSDEAEEAAAASGLGAELEAAGEEKEKFKVRDEVTVAAGELGEAPVHTGEFGGQVRLEAFREDKPVDKTDGVLSCAVGDELVAVYVDELHIGGTSPRQVEAKVSVIGEIDNAPRATQDVVPNPVIRARKKLVEATAFLELARIFDSMGLKEGAKAKADEGLERVDSIIRMESPIPTPLRQEAYKLKWLLYIAQEDFASAIATCRVFNRLYPASPYVDEALMSIGKIRMAEGDHATAIGVFRQILSLPKSQAKAEAQFLIAQATEAPGDERAVEAAIPQYRTCATKYADSEFAGPSLAKLVQYHIDKKDYSRANDLLEQIFQDHPDGRFLDLMLLKWVDVAVKLGDFDKARKKCEQLIFSYPGSEHALKAKAEYLPGIQKMLEKPAKKAPAAG